MLDVQFPQNVKITHTVPVQTVEVMYENVGASSVVMNPKL